MKVTDANTKLTLDGTDIINLLNNKKVFCEELGLVIEAPDKAKMQAVAKLKRLQDD